MQPDESRGVRGAARATSSSKPNTEGTQYERSMLYVTCRGQRFFAGTIGQASKSLTRPSDR